MAASGEPDPSSEGIETDVEATIAACDGDARAAVRALILVNAYLEAELERLGELVSRGFARGKVREK